MEPVSQIQVSRGPQGMIPRALASSLSGAVADQGHCCGHEPEGIIPSSKVVCLTNGCKVVDKRDVTDLGLFGGAPLFAEPRHVGRPHIGDSQRFLLRCADILKRRWLTNNGPCVQEFEGCVAALTGVPHAVAMCNATLALQVLVRALEFTGEVILPSLTFIATAHPLEWEGLP